MFQINPQKENESETRKINFPSIGSSKGFKHRHLDSSKNHISQVDSPEKIKDFFMRKTESNFMKNHLSPVKKFHNTPFHEKRLPVIFNLMKTDIIQIDNMIKTLSGILIYYKNPQKENLKNFKSSQNSNTLSFNKKIFELEKSFHIDVINYFEKIYEDSQNLSYLLKDFNCKNKEELICRMAYENYFNNLFIKKSQDLIFLANLTFNNNDNELLSSNFETHSKSFDIIFLIEQLEKKKNLDFECNSFYNQSDQPFKTYYGHNKQMSNININNTIIEDEILNSTIQSDDDMPKVLEFNVISDLLKFNTKNNILKHIKHLFNLYNDKAFHIMSSLVNEVSKEYNKTTIKIRKSEELIENFIMIRKILDDIFKTLTKENSEMKIKIQTLEKENDSLQTRLKDIQSRDMNSVLLKIKDENSRLEEFLTKYELKNDKSLIEEVEVLKCKYESLIIKNETLKDEKSLLQKQIDFFTQNMKKTSNLNKKQLDLNESYEKLLIEQFDVMRDSFVNRLKQTTERSNQTITRLKKELQRLVDEKSLQKNIKELLHNQIITLRSLFDL